MLCPTHEKDERKFKYSSFSAFPRIKGLHYNTSKKYKCKLLKPSLNLTNYEGTIAGMKETLPESILRNKGERIRYLECLTSSNNGNWISSDTECTSSRTFPTSNDIIHDEQSNIRTT